jgi:hypothetical protein
MTLPPSTIPATALDTRCTAPATLSQCLVGWGPQLARQSFPHAVAHCSAQRTKPPGHHPTPLFGVQNPPLLREQRQQLLRARRMVPGA